MKSIRCAKYTGEPADAIDLEELVKRLGDFFLQSGFESQFYGISRMDPERSMEALREAILRALQEGDLLPENAMSHELREMLDEPSAMNSQAVKDLLDKIMERMANEGFINPQQPPQVTPPPQTSARGQLGQPHERPPEARFEITDKTIDFEARFWRSEEHTSELQSRLHLVCRLLLEKKKKRHATQCRT